MIVIAIGILHFAAPFLFLLSRSLKRNPRKLVVVAVLILVMRLIDLLWMLVPAFSREHTLDLDGRGRARSVLVVCGWRCLRGSWASDR